MKKLLFFFLTTITFHVYAQNDSAACSQITENYNEFESETTYRTPLSKNCSLTKIVKAKKVIYYLYLKATGYSASFAEKGVKIILSDKQILSFPDEEIDLKIDEDGSRYVYSAFIRLPIEKINLLKKYGVVKWKLYVYESGYSEDETTEFMAQVNCLSNKN